MASVFREVVVDCTDPARVAAFWHDVLGWPVVDADGFFWLSATGEPTSPPLLVFVPVPEAKTVKNRWHLDVRVGEENVDEQVAKLAGRGATFLHKGSQGPHWWVTMADPEGNEFCVT